VNETLFSQIQRLFERTYAQVGINLEDCLIDRKRCAQLSILAGKSARELSELARTFLRRAGDQLYVGIYYSRWLSTSWNTTRAQPCAATSDPSSCLSKRSTRSNALQFKTERARSGRRILPQSRAPGADDTYLVLLCLSPFFEKRSEFRELMGWLRHLFARQCPEAAATKSPGPLSWTSELAPPVNALSQTLNGQRHPMKLTFPH
jgi:hypothetical protein